MPLTVLRFGTLDTGCATGSSGNTAARSRRLLFREGASASGRYTQSMLWFFERARARLQCEIRSRLDGPGYELVWTTPDGRTHIDRSEDAGELLQRRQLLEQRLRREGWVRFPPITPPEPLRRKT